MARAYEVEQRLGLSPQDAIVYASVVEHAQSAGSSVKLFVTQNRRDFLVVEDELASYGCKLFFTFDAAEGYVHSKSAGR